MSQDLPSAREDLAFLRRVVEGGDGGKGQLVLGWCYVWGGLLYGLQSLVQWAAGAGLIDFKGPPMASFTIGITVVFVLATIVIGRHYGPQVGGGSVGRAMGVTFGVIGLSNVVLVAVFAILQRRMGVDGIFVIYPIVVFAMQGAAWVIAGALKRRLWMGLVGAGWYVSAIAMALTHGGPYFALIVGVSLLGLMTAPGWALVRLAPKAG